MRFLLPLILCIIGGPIYGQRFNNDSTELIIKKDDNLWSIMTSLGETGYKAYDLWALRQDSNALHPDLIYPGMVFKLEKISAPSELTPQTQPPVIILTTCNQAESAKTNTVPILSLLVALISILVAIILARLNSLQTRQAKIFELHMQWKDLKEISFDTKDNLERAENIVRCAEAISLTASLWKSKVVSRESIWKLRGKDYVHVFETLDAHTKNILRINKTGPELLGADIKGSITEEVYKSIKKKIENNRK